MTRDHAFDRDNLQDRLARCMMGCDFPVSSSTYLPQFVYAGPGSYRSGHICVCGYHCYAHAVRLLPADKTLRKSHPLVCDYFRAVGAAEYDSFLCCADTAKEFR